MTRFGVFGAIAVLTAVAACGSNTVSGSSQGEDAGSSTSSVATLDRGPLGKLPTRKSPLPPTVSCTYDSDGSPAKPAKKPPATASTEGTAVVTLALGQGTVTLDLDRSLAPCTVNSFVSLAQQGYFNSTTCHRLTTDGIYVLQCGDPSGTGAGGPGYKFADEYPTDEVKASSFGYSRGFIAMANAGPATNGSQFFIVYGDSELPPAYTIFGRIGDGIKVIDGIADGGVKDGGQDGAPANKVEIVTASVA
ncbi:peptidylprolyl isomerase [Smaragdicoccus niigatensis]|uniref:peptidylprolyl isomerase n=1 Tax=Smaragdicoccus niigatensis TaxID=359359 RepID=UPI00037969E6|nr:peptidylprolyl isomerase [Smaragdicoccus niigatensis]